MAIVALEVPRGVGQYLTRLDVPGEKTPIDEMHVTIVQMDEELSPVDVAMVMGVVKEATVASRAFQVVVDHVSCFPGNDNGVPVICPVKSEGLIRLHDDIAMVLDARGIGYSKRFPVYQPHVTLAWANEQLAPTNLVSPLEWTASHVAMWPTRDGAFQSVRCPLRRSVTHASR